MEVADFEELVALLLAAVAVPAVARMVSPSEVDPVVAVGMVAAGLPVQVAADLLVQAVVGFPAQVAVDLPVQVVAGLEVHRAS